MDIKVMCPDAEMAKQVNTQVYTVYCTGEDAKSAALTNNHTRHGKPQDGPRRTSIDTDALTT